MARKILLADDSVTAQNMGRKILTDAGYEVVTVNNGSAALKKILEQRPDLIVLDVYMPGYSGLEVCQRIKENKETSRIPILLTVGKLEPFKPEEARRARADAFVVKPFEASELLAALTKLEDKIVPQAEPYKPGRFAKAAAAVEADSQIEDDPSWKARLRIPTGKKSEPEPDVDYTATQGKGFRDLRVEETGKKSRPKAKESDDAFERPIPAGLPADITPEEIAAITAAAARLNGTAPVADSKRPVEQVAPEAQVAPPALPTEESAPVTFASAPDVEASDARTEIQDGVQSDVQFAPAEPATEAQAGSAEAAVAAEMKQDAPAPLPEAEAAVNVAAAESAPPESIPAPEVVVSEPQEPAVAPAEDSAAAQSVASDAAEPIPVPATTETSIPAAKETAAPPPADDEVMAALQSLMPAAENDSASAGSNGGGKHDEVAAALAAIGPETHAGLRAHAPGPRWIAEEVALGAGEATLSLEREMEQAYAAVSTREPLLASAASFAVSKSESVMMEAEPRAEAPAETNPEPEVAEPAVYVMASAAGAGDVAPVAAGTQMVSHEAVSVEPTQPHPDTQAAAPVVSTEVVEMPLRITEIESPVAASVATPVMPETQTPEAPTAAPQIPETQIAEGAEEMANWKNIRDSIAGAAPKRAPSKEEIAEPEPVKTEAETPAVPVHEAPPAPSASDPKAIASIVDSVLAELRPRIVEEIAKKLSADPKKD